MFRSLSLDSECIFAVTDEGLEARGGYDAEVQVGDVKFSHGTSAGTCGRV
jgi:hypothetical protein